MKRLEYFLFFLLFLSNCTKFDGFSIEEDLKGKWKLENTANDTYYYYGKTISKFGYFSIIQLHTDNDDSDWVSTEITYSIKVINSSHYKLYYGFYNKELIENNKIKPIDEFLIISNASKTKILIENVRTKRKITLIKQ